MDVVTRQIRSEMEGASWIRRMFDAGLELKQRIGADQVFDFSLGNPDVPPPAAAAAALRDLAGKVTAPMGLGYCPNAGLPSVRAALARRLAAEQQAPVEARHLVLTCGAAGGLVTFFRAVLEPGDEVLCFAPYFVEYGAYAGHFGGVLRAVPSIVPDFTPDLAALEAAIGPRTRVVLVNSPNNPTGRIYDAATMQALGALLSRVNQGRERPVFLVSDEPYRRLAYGGAAVPAILPLTPFSLVVGSFSKSLSLAGERVGYLLVNPAMPDAQVLVDALTLTNRTLGFVNAPVVGQRLVEALVDESVDVGVYDRRRRAMAEALTGAGIPFHLPEGAFYFFPEVPGGDDQAFVRLLLEENILAVPGRGFGMPGYMRLTFCVDEQVIRRAAPGFARAARKARGG
ncbi:aminotransferase class I and II [Anaeromyxobacter dehalogenans 2CP-1]|uniref:Aminotransferase n=1 Tax=Anaeromyxobacter dehalogenans (strain ATCC BAA-258 / DSM 21875 / 2CP-1) TaxID=455488 RepID=B8JBZ7_ANAD2|nr:pyridoxal phosphate-dependent aminotransferase [Anaeromyxobacter dehalogenans]ACL63919.1 aminotransferase class I and II [Anaeromyxobacter dehalogenans 2CP-1]